MEASKLKSVGEDVPQQTKNVRTKAVRGKSLPPRREVILGARSTPMIRTVNQVGSARVKALQEIQKAAPPEKQNRAKKQQRNKPDWTAQTHLEYPDPSSRSTNSPKKHLVTA